jgi:hypothetical protein
MLGFLRPQEKESSDKQTTNKHIERRIGKREVQSPNMQRP